MMIDYSRRLVNNELTIFLLHGVVKKSQYKIRNYTKKHLDEDYFYHTMKSLRNVGHPLSLDEVLHLITSRNPFPNNAFAITFDDGFMNNYTVAAPILTDLKIPATFYISTGMVDANAMTWIDRIEFCFEHNQKDKIKLPWETTDRVLTTRANQIDVLDEIRNYVKSHKEINQDEFVQFVYSEFQVEEVRRSNDPLDRKLLWDQVSELNSHELFSVGGHAHNHEILSFLSHDELHHVVTMSLTYLLEKAGIETIHYSYPEGLEHCYSEAVISELKANNIKICPTAIDGTNPIGSDPFHLRRIFLV